MKPLIKSKTFWLNVLGAIAIVATAEVLPAKYSALALSLANVGMRLVTTATVAGVLTATKDGEDA